MRLRAVAAALGTLIVPDLLDGRLDHKVQVGAQIAEPAWVLSAVLRLNWRGHACGLTSKMAAALPRAHV
jgi:hypothetical protein